MSLQISTVMTVEAGLGSVERCTRESDGVLFPAQEAIISEISRIHNKYFTGTILTAKIGHYQQLRKDII